MANNKSNPSYKKDSSTLNAAQLFGFCILTGGISIIVGTVFGTSSWIPAWFAMMINFGLPVCVILFYTYSVISAATTDISTSRASRAISAVTQARAGAYPSGTQLSHTSFIFAKSSMVLR